HKRYNNRMIPVYWLMDALTVILLIALLAAAMLRGGYKNQLNRLYAYCVMFIVVWVPALHVSNDVAFSTQVASIADYAVFSASLATAVMILKIIVKMRDERNKSVRPYEPFLWLMVILAATPLVSQGVVRHGDIYGVEFGPLAPFYMMTLTFVMSAMLYEFYRGLKMLRGPSLRRFQIVGASIAATTVLVLLLSVVLPLATGILELTEFGLMPMIILVSGLYYSVVKHKLFDVKLVAIRTVAYALSILTMASAYFGLAYFVSVFLFKEDASTGVSVSPINVMLALVLAFIFQPIKQFFDHWTNRIFYRDSYDTDEFIARLSRVLTSTTALHEVLERALDVIASTIKANGGLFIIYRDHHEDVLVGHKKYNGFNVEDYGRVQQIVHVFGSGLLVVEPDGARSRSDDQRYIHNLLARHKVALVLPLVTTSQTIGYLFLGEQMGSNYGKRDVAVLETVADELVIAIQNARSVQVVRDLNTHLEQRIDSATKELRASNTRLVELDTMKDEFVSMASHQLRTPLTSVKGYISMVLEGDAGKITKTQRQLLQEAFTSSERMVHLISDFLNVSRLQTGKFVVDRKEADLAEITRQEVTNIGQIASSHQMRVEYKKPTRFPRLYIDEGKIRQVIMNFIDNAIYYSPDAKVVKLSLTVEEGDVVLRVIDHGMGVPEGAQDKLFTKFFRAENARKQRPDGTGVGLFLAKKVIDGHGGSLVFESELDKGSTFGFRLPIKKLSEPPSPHEREEIAETLPQ
ncbi:MAG: GAF domain-containing sensor histidine kinase, partial [Candidatus Saccharimonas sp.]